MGVRETAIDFPPKEARKIVLQVGKGTGLDFI